jgi:hypothetical protein
MRTDGNIRVGPVLTSVVLCSSSSFCPTATVTRCVSEFLTTVVAYFTMLPATAIQCPIGKDSCCLIKKLTLNLPEELRRTSENLKISGISAEIGAERYRYGSCSLLAICRRDLLPPFSW